MQEFDPEKALMGFQQEEEKRQDKVFDPDLAESVFAKRDASLAAKEGLNRTPEQTAEVIDMTKRSGYPQQVVRSDPPTVKRQLKEQEVSKVAQDNPILGRWMSNTDNLSLIQDDLGFWGSLANTQKRGGLRSGQGVSQYVAEGGVQNLQDQELSLGEIFIDEQQKSFKTPNALGLVDVISRTAARYGMSRFNPTSKEAAQASLQRVGAFRKKISETPMSEPSTRFMGKLSEAKGFWETLDVIASDPIGAMVAAVEIGAESIPQMIAAGATTYATRNPALGVSVLGVSSGLTERYSDPADYLEKQGFDLNDPQSLNELLKNPQVFEDAKQYGFTRGAIIGSFDTLTGGLASKTFGGPIRNMLTQMGIQMTGGGGGEAFAQLATGEQVNWGEVFMEALGELATTPIEIASVSGHYFMKQNEERKAQNYSDELEKIFGDLEEAKLFDLNDSKGRELFQSIMDSTNKGDVQVNASGLASALADELGPELNNVLKRLGLDPETFNQAVETGNDVTLKSGDIASVIRGNDPVLRAILLNARSDDNAQTVTEAQEAVETARQAVEDEMTRAQEDVTQEQIDMRPADAVFEMVKRQLDEAGQYNKSTNELNAEIARSMAKVMQDYFDKEGMEYNVFHDLVQRGFDVKGYKQEVEKKSRDVTLKAQLQNIRKKKDNPRGELVDLFNYMKEHGRVKAGGTLAGELMAMDITPKTVPGLFSNKGTFGDADNLVASEFEDIFGVTPKVDTNGYVDRAWLLQKISEGTLKDGLQNVEEQLSSLLDKAGLDLNTLTDDEIIDALVGDNQEETGRILDQVDTESAAFKEWFGDSKVVDENGGPLVVYHGTSSDIEFFDKKKIGSNHPTYSFGFHFSNLAEEASIYSKENGNIVPVYLRIENPLIIETNLIASNYADNNKSELVRDILNSRKDKKVTDENTLLRALAGEDVEVLQKVIKATPYDGVIIKGKTDTNYITFSPTQIKSIHNRGTFDPNDPRILYQDGETKLSALHNLTSENLLYADKLGGLAAPSIGIVKGDMGIDGYGDITLIGDKSLGDPEQTEVYDADAYTSTFPTPEYGAAKRKDAQRLIDEIKPWDNKYNGQRTYLIDSTWDNATSRYVKPNEIIRQWLNDNAIKAMYVNETTGINVRVPMMDAPLVESISSDPKIVSFFKSIPDSVWNKGANSSEQVKIRKDIVPIFKKALEKKYQKLKTDLRNNLLESYAKEAINEDGELNFGAFSRLHNDQKRIGKKEIDTKLLSDNLDKKLKGKEAKFQAWVQEKVMDIFGDPFLKIRGRKEAYTLENIVDYMTNSGVQAKEKTMTFGPGMARAAASKQFTDLEWMRNEAKDSLKQKSELKEEREKADKKLEDYRNAVLEYYTNKDYRGEIDTWNGLDDSMKALAYWAKNKKSKGNKAALKAGLRSNDFSNVPDKIIDLGIEAGEAMMYAPVPYFEAKPHRAVGLDEFSGAVVPNDVSKEALAVLKKHNIKVKKYGSRYDEEARTKAVVELRNSLSKKGKSVLFQNDEKGIRGRFNADTNQISFTQISDKTTFVHELAHFYLEWLNDTANGVEVPPEIINMRDEIFKLIGADKNELISTEAHEIFAESFESYLETGKAPTKALRKVFNAFKRFILDVYDVLRGKGQDVLQRADPRLFEWFDRILATENEIAEAEAESGLTIPPELAKVIDEEDQKTIMDIAEDMHDTAVQQLYSQRLKYEKREVQKWWKKAYKEMKDQAKIDLLNSQRFRARHFLRTGEFPTGETPEHMKNVKMSTDELKFIFGDGITNTLRYLVNSHTKKKGANVVSPDQMATMLGYSSFEELYQDTKSAGGIDAAARGLASSRMRERYGDPLNDGTIEENAMAHVAMGKRSTFLEAQVKALGKRYPKGSVTPLKLIRATIQANLEAKPLSSVLTPKKFLQASIRAGKRADKALASGDTQTAFTEKQRQLVNYEMFRHSSTMKDKVDVIDRRLKRRGKKAIDPNYINPKLIEAIKSLLPAYGYGNPINGQDIQAGLKRVNEIIAEHNAAAEKDENAGIILDILPWITEASNAKELKELTYQQANELDQAVTKLWNVGKGEGSLTKAEIAEKRAKYAEEIRSNNPTRKSYNSRKEKDRYNKGDDDGNISVSISNLGVMLQRMPFILKFLSPDMHRDIMERFDAAAAKEQELLGRVITGINEAFKKYTLKERTTMDSRKFGLFHIDELGESWSKEDLLSLLMQWGTQSNRDAVINGDPRLNEEIVQSILNKHITKTDLEFIQQVFDTTESLWPEIAELEKLDKGVVPEKLEATPIKIAAGEIPGGYMRLKYSRDNPKGSNVGDREIATDAGKWGSATASTKNGSTIERVKNSGMEVRLDFGVLFEHLQETITDISYRHAVRYASKILISGDVATAISETMGQEYNDMIKQTLKNVARNDVTSDGPAAKFFRSLRINNSIAIMTYNLKSAVSAPSGIFQSMVELGVWPVMKSIGEFTNPLNASRIIKEINQKSQVMNVRSKIVNRDLRQTLKKIGKSILRAQMTDQGYYPLVKLDKLVASIVWNAAEKKSLAEGKSQKQATFDANQAVSMTQSSGNLFDISPAESGGELYRTLTFLYNYMGSTYNLTRNIIRKTGRDYRTADGMGKAKIVGKAAVDLALLHIAQMIAYEIMVGNLPDDDDDKLEFFLWGFANQIFGMIPFLSGAVRSAEFGLSPSTLPADSIMRSGTRLIKNANKDIEDGELSRETVRSALQVVGAAKGVPGTFEALKIEKGINALSEGEDVNAWEMFVSGVEKQR